MAVRLGDSDAVCEGVCCWLAEPEAVSVSDGVALGENACEGDAEGVGLGACEAVLEDVTDGVTVCETVDDCVGVGEHTDLRPCTKSELWLALSGATAPEIVAHLNPHAAIR